MAGFFLSRFNGRAFFLNEDFHSGNCLELYTVASVIISYGAVYDKEWFYGSWPSSWQCRNISALELFPNVAAVEVWSNTWANQSECFFTNNEALVHVINKQTSCEPHIIAVIRRMVRALISWHAMYLVE